MFALYCFSTGPVAYLCSTYCVCLTFFYFFFLLTSFRIPTRKLMMVLKSEIGGSRATEFVQIPRLIQGFIFMIFYLCLNEFYDAAEIKKTNKLIISTIRILHNVLYSVAGYFQCWYYFYSEEQEPEVVLFLLLLHHRRIRKSIKL